MNWLLPDGAFFWAYVAQCRPLQNLTKLALSTSLLTACFEVAYGFHTGNRALLGLAASSSPCGSSPSAGASAMSHPLGLPWGTCSIRTAVPKECRSAASLSMAFWPDSSLSGHRIASLPAQSMAFQAT